MANGKLNGNTIVAHFLSMMLSRSRLLCTLGLNSIFNITPVKNGVFSFKRSTLSTLLFLILFKTGKMMLNYTNWVIVYFRGCSRHIMPTASFLCMENTGTPWKIMFPWEFCELMKFLLWVVRSHHLSGKGDICALPLLTKIPYCQPLDVNHPTYNYHYQHP